MFFSIWRQISHGIIRHTVSPNNAREIFFHFDYLCLIDSLNVHKLDSSYMKVLTMI